MIGCLLGTFCHQNSPIKSLVKIVNLKANPPPLDNPSICYVEILCRNGLTNHRVFVFVCQGVMTLANIQALRAEKCLITSVVFFTSLNDSYEVHLVYKHSTNNVFYLRLFIISNSVKPTINAAFNPVTSVRSFDIYCNFQYKSNRRNATKPVDDLNFIVIQNAVRTLRHASHSHSS